MKPQCIRAMMAAGFLLAAALASVPLKAQSGQGATTITVLPNSKEAPPPSISAQDLDLHINGKVAQVTNLAPSPGSPLELVLLIDGSARVSLSRQFPEIEQFIRALPPDVKVGIAYMVQGGAEFAVPLTSSRERAAQAQRVPSGMAGTEGSPYFCLSDLAKHWPSRDASARREVIMISDGVDRYEMQYNANDPYVQAAITDCLRAHLVVYSIYWLSQGRADASGYENDAGQNLLLQLTSTTGGRSYWFGSGNPVTFQSYFEDLLRRFQNQFELGVSAPLSSKPEVEAMKLKLTVPGSEVTAPEEIYMTSGPR